MESAGVQIRVSDLLFALQKRYKMILSLTLIGAAFGVILFAMTFVEGSVRSFEVSGSFAISTQNHSDGVYINGSQIANNNDFHLAEDMVDSVVYVLRSNAVLNQVINQLGLLGTTVDELRSDLTVNQYQSTQILEMHFTWRTEEEAESIWQAIIDVANQTLPTTLQLGQLVVINPPEVVRSTSSSSGKILPVILTLLGFLSGLGFAVIELLVHPTLTNPRDAETMFGLETIGIIPRDDAFFRNRQGSILGNRGPDRFNVLQNYSAAAYILRNRLGTKEQHHCFYVTSTTTGEGKSTVAANLAIQLSDMEHRTLLIDFDVRNPSLGTLFMDKVDYAHSLNALYRGEATEEDAITTLTGYLDLLPAVLEHNAIALDGAVLDLIQRMSEKYEYIILDSSPVGEVSETLSLNRIATTVLYVIGYDSTPLPAIQDALEKLDKSGIRVLGCVVNRMGTGGKQSSDEKKTRSSSTTRRKTTRRERPKKSAPAEKAPRTRPEKPKKEQKRASEPKKEPKRSAKKSFWPLGKKSSNRSQGKHAKNVRSEAQLPETPEKLPVPEETPVNIPAEPVAPPTTEQAQPVVPQRPTDAPAQPATQIPWKAEESPNRQRNVLSELMAEEKPMQGEERSAQSVLDELLNMSHHPDDTPLK